MAADQKTVSSQAGWHFQAAATALRAEMFPELEADVLFCSLRGVRTHSARRRKPTSRLLVYSHIMSQAEEQLRRRKMRLQVSLVFQLNTSLFARVKLSVTWKTKKRTLSFQPFKCTKI